MRQTSLLAAPVRRDSSVSRADRVSGTRVIVALGSRLILFALFQALIAGLLAVSGNSSPWSSSVAWWPLAATACNLVSIGMLRAFLSTEGSTYRQFWRFERATVGRDVLITLGLLVIGGFLAMGPNFGLATLLWGDPQVALDIFIQPLPLWAAIVALVGFPLTIAFSELPTYYGYARPRLERLGVTPWLAISLAASMHALQHATLPLVFDGRFLLWRALMFLPFALFVGLSLRWRPRLLPYLMIAHGLLDLSVGVMVLQVALNQHIS